VVKGRDKCHYRGVLMEDGRGAATHAQALSAVHSFLGWVADMNGLRFPLRMAERLLRVPKTDVVRPYVTCTRAEVERLVESAVNFRDKALILVMLGGGLRVSEVEGLNCSDLVEVDSAPVLWVRKGKGNKGSPNTNHRRGLFSHSPVPRQRGTLCRRPQTTISSRRPRRGIP